MITSSALAREAEQLRFRIEHHLGGDPEKLVRLLRQLEVRVPHHPIVRTARAVTALPDTALPGPPPELSSAAARWLAGDPEGALEHARAALAERPHPRTRVTVADLHWHLGAREEALVGWQLARDELGPLPPLAVRRGRAALVDGRSGEALDEAVRALLQNPLYGTAFVLLTHAHRARGQEALPVPLPTQAVRTADGLRMVSGLGERGQASWTAALRASQVAPAEETPPGHSGVAALLDQWRTLAPGSTAEERQCWPIATLDRWEREGTLETYLWASGLTPDRAEDFRLRSDPEASDRRFWREAILERR